MRFGAPVPSTFSDPAEWIAALQERSYTAAYCPLKSTDDEATVTAFVQAAAQANIVMAEVGAWSNPLSPDEATRNAALTLCREQLALADRVGARCCVNIAGSRGAQWDGPHPDNFTADTFDLLVETVRGIIDAVKPSRTFYTLEPMPWMYPDSVESYEALIQAIDRPQFAVHFDPVNLICSPQRYYGNAELVRDFCARLGGQIRSCHAKDIRLSSKLTTHLDEVRPGQGELDYRTLLQEVNKLDPDTPFLLEHLPSAAEYDLAAQHVRTVAQEVGISL